MARRATSAARSATPCVLSCDNYTVIQLLKYRIHHVPTYRLTFTHSVIVYISESTPCHVTQCISILWPPPQQYRSLGVPLFTLSGAGRRLRAGPRCQHITRTLPQLPERSALQHPAAWGEGSREKTIGTTDRDC